MIALLFAPLLALILGWTGPAAGADEKFDAVKQGFEQAAQAGDAQARSAALEALLANSGAGVGAVLSAENARITAIVDEQDRVAARARAGIERRQVLIEQWKSREARDEGAKGAIERETEALTALRQDLERAEAKLANERPWQSELRSGAARLLAGLHVDKRRKVEQEWLVDAGEHPSAEVRAGSIDLLGVVGGVDSAAGLTRLTQALGETRDKLDARLPKLMADVRKMEARLAKEGSQTDGFSRATMDQYAAVKRDAAEVRAKVHETSKLCDRAARAAAAALERAQGKDLDELCASTLRAFKKSKGRARSALLAILTDANVPAVQALLRAQLAAETEPLAQAGWIDALAAQGDVGCVPELLAKHLIDPAWIVKSRAAAALAKLRSREAVPAMIERLAAEEGRMRSDLGRALTSLTAQDFHGNVELWRRWWKDNAESFQVAPQAETKTALEEARDAIGVSFFGISTESQRILFVVDCSKSMDFSMTPKNNPTDEGGRPYDMPDTSKGEISRLTAAKRDLEKALGGIKDGGQFNIIAYAADVWSWDDAPVVMNPAARKEALAYVGALEGAAGTNIYSALERALDMAGVKDGSVWSKPEFDTIFFLTDGRATIGVTTDTEQILSYVRERNRTAGIVIHTIGLSGAQDAELMRRLAEENHGQYVAR